MLNKFSRFSRWKREVFLTSAFKRGTFKCGLHTDSSEKNLSDTLKYLLILDFEATCERNIKMEQEIIEFPCLKVDLSDFREVGRFHCYVKPVVNPVLSYFCIELTGILQEMVDDEKPFPEVYASFEKWRESEGLTKENSLYVTSGDWDLGSMMPNQCQLSKLEVPSHMMQWIDIKKLYANFSRKYFNTFALMTESLGLKLEGRTHSGICDCINILKAVKKMGSMGLVFKPTSRLVRHWNHYRVESIRTKRQVNF